MRIFKII